MNKSIAGQMESYFDRLWPICRSISGDGVRESLKILSELIPLDLVETKSGTKVYDWMVPKEWNVSDAYVISPTGVKVIDFKENNLHLMSYSIPINKKLSWTELEHHLHYSDELPSAIPYRTSYYKEDWAFCIQKETFDQLPREGLYSVVIDTTLTEGSLTYGEKVLAGASDQEIFFSSYICHPSMANNELSGPILLSFLYDKISQLKNRKYTYRFLIAPETIGSIIYLSRHGEYLKSMMQAGYILTCTAMDQSVIYKRSRRGNAYNDRVAEHVLLKHKEVFDHEIIDFFPLGSDERQYCSPGFDLPVGSLARGMYGRYPEYHSSLDDKSLISFKALEEMLEFYIDLINTMEQDEFYVNQNPYCEPQLGKRGIYPNTGGELPDETVHALMWVLNMSDGNFSIREIAEASCLEITLVREAARKLVNCGLLESRKI